jgi:hypothetical protein
MSNCHKHENASAVSQCSCGNFLCLECNSMFIPPICIECYYQQVINDITIIETDLKREKATLFIAPLYFPFAIMQFVQYWGIYKSSASRDPLFNILNAGVLVFVWAVIRLQIFKASRHSQPQVTFYGCFPLIFFIVKICFVGGLGTVIVPFDLIMGYSKISNLKKKKLQLIEEREIVLNDFAIVES